VEGGSRRDVRVATEDKDVPIGIANLELPVVVRLLFQWHLDECCTLHALVERADSSCAEIGIPQPGRPAVREVRFLVAHQVEQHDFGAVTLQTRVNERLPVGEMARRVETEVLRIPSSGGGHVADKKCGNG
jgi:hypothetical protein